MKNFNQGRSVAETEGVPVGYGAPDQYRQVSGMDRYAGASWLLPDDNGRHAPIRGNGTFERLGRTHGVRLNDGGGVIQHPERHEVMGLGLVRVAQNVSAPQMQHALTRTRRGMPGKQDYPDGTGSAPRIKAVQRFGLGPAYDRPGPSGHAPNAPLSDYIRAWSGPAPDVLSKYVAANEVLAPVITAAATGLAATRATGSRPEALKCSTRSRWAGTAKWTAGTSIGRGPTATTLTSWATS